ncbi:MAG: NAD(P)-dependent oxidoreductase [Halobacteria archaeon]|nr:NAD(P)-dependent oxidoreductase [Halobacteria archaeon]
MEGNGKRALVTGACGFMGSRLCEYLVENGYDVRGTDLESSDTSRIDGLDVEFVPADLTEPETLDDVVEDIDIIFHTAAIFSYSSLIDWEVFEEINVRGTENLCEAAVDAGVDSMVHWSTSGVYGKPDEDLLPVTEDHPKNPESKYDRSKWMQEKVAMSYHGKNGFSVKAIRPVTVYGPGNTYGAAQVLLSIANGQLKVFPLFCDYRMPIIHVDDVIRAAVHLDENGEGGEAYNVVDNQNYTMNNVIKYVAGLTDNHVYGVPIGNKTYKRLSNLRVFIPAIEHVYDLFGEESPLEKDALFYMKGNYWVSNEKLKKTGFELKYPDYKEGVRKTVEWYEQQGMIEA